MVNMLNLSKKKTIRSKKCPEYFWVLDFSWSVVKGRDKITAGVQYFYPCRKYRFFHNVYTVTPKCNIGLVAGMVSGERMRKRKGKERVFRGKRGLEEREERKKDERKREETNEWKRGRRKRVEDRWIDGGSKRGTETHIHTNT